MRVAALVSGGVDSSVALARLVDAGHDVHAFYLKVWLEDELASLAECPWEEDLRFVRAVTRRLGVPLTAAPLQQAYRERVVAYLLDELERGGTPSPDLLCNARIKFGAFLDFVDAGSETFERVASGHYAVCRDGAGGPELHRAADPVKDQTYFLSRLAPSRLGRCVFPLGASMKAEVRAEAARRGLATAGRPDSQGICFLGNVSYRDFVRAHLGTRPGPVVDEATGEEIGVHHGHWLHTIGQRRGLGLSGGPWYVVKKDPAGNRIVVRRGGGRPRARFALDDFHWIGEAPGPADSGLRLSFRVRHGPGLVPGRLDPPPPGESVGELRLDRPDAGVAPGQFAVFYDGTRCLGSARIAATRAGRGSRRRRPAGSCSR